MRGAARPHPHDTLAPFTGVEVYGEIEARRSEAQDNGDYQADAIQVLEGLEAVRRRPAMYIGSTGAACTTWSTRSWTTRSTRRWPATATRIDVTIHADNSITVMDNGRGIPVDMHPTEKMPGRRSRA